MNQEKCEAIVEKYQGKRGSVIAILQDVQEAFGYIPEDVVFRLADRLNIPASSFFGVATFYAQFHLKPRGKHIITACCGTACHVKGAEPIINRMRADLAIAEGEDTTPDGQFTLEKVACIGACSIAPVLVVDKNVYGCISADKATKLLEKYD